MLTVSPFNLKLAFVTVIEPSFWNNVFHLLIHQPTDFVHNDTDLSQISFLIRCCYPATVGSFAKSAAVYFQIQFEGIHAGNFGGCRLVLLYLQSRIRTLPFSETQNTVCKVSTFGNVGERTLEPSEVSFVRTSRAPTILGIHCYIL